MRIRLYAEIPMGEKGYTRNPSVVHTITMWKKKKQITFSGTIDQLQPNERGILVHARQIVRRAIRHGRQSNTVRTSQRCVQTLAAMACQGKRIFLRHEKEFILLLPWEPTSQPLISIVYFINFIPILPRPPTLSQYHGIRVCVCTVQGTEGFEKHMDHLMELSEYMVEKIKSSPDKFYLLLEPEMVNVSFWYVPKRLRNVPHTPDRAEILGKVSWLASECDFKPNNFYTDFSWSMIYR